MIQSIKIVFLLAIVFAACQQTRTSQPSKPSQPAEKTSQSSPAQLGPGWKVIDANRHFSFHLPDNMKDQKARGIDSYVGEYRNSKMRIGFDYGAYSNSLTTYSGEPEYQEFKKTISDKAAKIIFFRNTNAASGYKYYAAVHFSLAEKNNLEANSGLTLDAGFDDPAEWETVKRIFESVTFPK
jgi:hypothetical protein